MLSNPKFELDKENWVQQDASKWGESSYLPRVPTIKEITSVCDPLKTKHPIPDDPRQEMEELRELAKLRDDPNAIPSKEGDKNKREPISKFLQIRPQPLGAVYNQKTPVTQDVIQTGRELARWFENEVPGLAHRHALHYLFPQYIITPPAQARISAALEIAIYGSLLAAWHYKWADPDTSFRGRPFEVDKTINIIYDTQVALFRLDVDSTYNPRRYQRGGGKESGPFQGFSGLDGQVDA